jgi:hypothetical protein
MSGVKIANENTTNGVSGEPMGGMSGSYSNLALFPNTTNYIFAWQSRGALDLTQNTWMGDGYTQCSPRWLNHNVAIATMSSKNTLTGSEATSTVGAAEGDSQVNWITYSSTDDHQNVHVATLNDNLSMVSWETLTNPDCQPVPLSCTGTYAGTSFQFVDRTGAKVGSVVNSTSVFVSGDFANVGTDKVCWPYVKMTWDLSAPKDSATPVTSMSFACASSGDSAAVAVASSSSTPVVQASSTAVKIASSSVAAVPTTSATEVFVATSSAPVVGTTAADVVAVDTTASAIESVPTSSFSVEPYISAIPVVSVDDVSNTLVQVQTSIMTVVPIEATSSSVPFEVSTAAATFETSAPASFSNRIPSSIPILSGLPTGFPANFPTGLPSGFPTGTGAWGPRGTGFFDHFSKVHRNGTHRTHRTHRTTTSEAKAKPTATGSTKVNAVAEVNDDKCGEQYDF